MPLVKVTAELVTNIALSPTGVGTELDAICTLQMCRHLSSIGESKKHNVQRQGENVKEQGQIPIPIKRTWVDQDGKRFPVSHCSSAIIESEKEYRQYYHKSFPSHQSDQLAEKQRTKFARGGGVLKSTRLPLRKSQTKKIVWFAELRTKKEIGRSPMSWLRSLLNKVEFIGKKTSQGHGCVASWTVEPTDIDAAWIYEGVLMRPLPASIVSRETVGKRRSFGGVAAPYWQADFFCDRYVPA